MLNQENKTEVCGQPVGMCAHCDDLGCICNPWWDDHHPYWIPETNDEGGDNK